MGDGEKERRREGGKEGRRGGGEKGRREGRTLSKSHWQLAAALRLRQRFISEHGGIRSI